MGSGQRLSCELCGSYWELIGGYGGMGGGNLLRSALFAGGACGGSQDPGKFIARRGVKIIS